MHASCSHAIRPHYARQLKKQTKQIGHPATPRRASATAPLRTGADTCKTGSGAGKRSEAKSDPVRRRSNHAWTEDQAGRQKRYRRVKGSSHSMECQHACQRKCMVLILTQPTRHCRDPVPDHHRSASHASTILTPSTADSFQFQEVSAGFMRLEQCRPSGCGKALRSSFRPHTQQLCLCMPRPLICHAYAGTGSRE